jgi:hypothetical protein
MLQLRTVQLTRHHCDAAVTHCTVTKHHCDAPFIIHVFPVYKFCPSMIDNSSLQVPSCNIRNFTKFSAGHNNRPPLDAVSLVCSDIDIDICIE